MLFDRIRHLRVNRLVLGSSVGAAAALYLIGETTAADWRLYLAAWSIQVIFFSYWFPDD